MPLASRRRWWLSRVLTLDRHAFALRVEALLLLYRVRSALNKQSFAEAREGLLATVAADHHREEAYEPQGIGRAVESAARFVPGAECVARALAGQAMLMRRNVPSTIHFGFLRADSGKVEGHAWLEDAGGVVTGGIDLERFTRTVKFEVTHTATGLNTNASPKTPAT